MQNLIKAKACLFAGILVLTSLIGGCNKDIGSDKENIVLTTVTTETTAETTLSETTAESETITSAVSEQSDAATATEQPTSVIAATTTQKTTATTKTTVPTTTTTKVTTTTAAPTTTTPKATQPPQTQPPATNPPVTTTKATEPTVPFDPQVYVDYAREYGESIGLEYMPDLGNYPQWGGDKPRDNASWNVPINLSPEISDEIMKNFIRWEFELLVEHDKAIVFRLEVVNNEELGWLTPYDICYKLFVYYG